MAQTRVDLRHLLEDIRDSYACPVEEAIITELIANALDSGASTIQFLTDSAARQLRVQDDGAGMGRSRFEEYHDIASTSKVRGRGIGFAGVGAKLALLVSREVRTETRTAHGVSCSRWWLADRYRAPWEEAPAPGWITDGTGTAVGLELEARAGEVLLNAELIQDIIQRHFEPVLDAGFAKVLALVYQRRIRFTVNGQEVTGKAATATAAREFELRSGHRRLLFGFGSLRRVAEPLPEEQRGIAVSTYGKVIKRGWEWLDLPPPRDPARVTGLVEVPELVACLTTNKNDFMRDPRSLQKYYKVRKTIQQKVIEALGELGEAPLDPADTGSSMDVNRLQRELGRAVSDVLSDFPELTPLFGRKRAAAGEGTLAAAADGALTGTPDPTAPVPEGLAVAEEAAAFGTDTDAEPPQPQALPGLAEEAGLAPAAAGEPATPAEGRRRRPGLRLLFDRETGGDELAWLRGDTLWINALHPAYKRVAGSPGERIYVTCAASVVLAQHVEAGKPPLAFVERFLAAWGSKE